MKSVYIKAIFTVTLKYSCTGFVLNQPNGLRISNLEMVTTFDTEVLNKSDEFIKKQIEDLSGISITPRMEEDITSHSTTILTKRREVRPFPLSLIINQKEIKYALLLAAVDPKIEVLIEGGRGTGKSVMARAMRNIVPSHISRIKDSEYNIHPKGEEGVDSFLLQQLNSGEITLESMEKELIPTPFVQIPLGVMDDSLIGTVDLERSLETGNTVFSPGLLAKAHRGILYIDEINLLEEDVADVLLKVMSDGEVTVEREGLSVTYPCKPIVIATFNPEEGELREHLRDRFAISLSTDARLLSTKERVTGVDNVLGFSGGLQHQSSDEAEKRLNQAEIDEQSLRTKVELARMSMSKGVNITCDQLKYICEEACRAGTEGQRAEIYATQVAKASSALDGRDEVNANDLKVGVQLSILPRATVYPENVEYEDEIGSTESPSSPPPPSSTSKPPPIMEQSDMENDNTDSEEGKSDDDDNDTSIEMEENEEDPDNEPEELAIPEEFMFGVEEVKVDPNLLKFSKWTRKGRGGKRNKIFSLLRGRFVKAIFPRGGGRSRLAVGATLRAAAPHQKYRREHSIGTKRERRPVLVEKDDFRIKKMSRKAGTLVIFLVDASGSMALNRMNAAKGAAIELLAEAYKSRDQISLISFHSSRAEVLAPPTKSIALTKNRLETLPCGGGSPLAHALMLAAQVGLNTIKVKQAVGRVVIVCITDGRANIPLELSDTGSWSGKNMPSREFLKEEVLACAQKLALLSNIDFVCIDTEDSFVGTGMAKDIATAALGKYMHIGKAEESAVAHIVKQQLE